MAQENMFLHELYAILN